MPVSAVWDNPQHTTIRLVFEGHWTWGEYCDLCHEVMARLDNVNTPVDLITDFRTTYLPKGGFKQLRQGEVFFLHPRVGNNVLVDAHGFIHTVALMLCGIYANKAQSLLFASTVEKARSALAQRREQPIAC